MTDREACCPSCGSSDRMSIVYGLPTEETVKRADRGEVALGGCLVDDRNPRWQCRGCGATWGRWRDAGQ